jgi:hypothetical protein
MRERSSRKGAAEPREAFGLRRIPPPSERDAPMAFSSRSRKAAEHAALQTLRDFVAAIFNFQ